MGALMSFSQEEPEPGDLIEIPRRHYSHWALYVGGGNVIHLTGSDGASGYSISTVPSPHTEKGVVKKEPLAEVVAGGKYSVNNKYDKNYKCRPVEETLRIAEALVGQEVDYSLLGQNCEHFVTWLRYRIPMSEQVEEGLVQLAGGLAGLAIFAFENL